MAGAELRRTASPRRCGTASSSTSTSTARHGPRYDQDLRFGAGNARGAFWTVDIVENGGYDGPRHFDFKPPRTEDMDGVWASAAGLHAQLPDPAREGRGRSGPTPRCSRRCAPPASTSSPYPTLAAGETVADLRAEAFDPDEAGRARAWRFERLDQLALEHLYGVR